MPLAGIRTQTDHSSTRVRRRGNVSRAQRHGKNAVIRVRPAGDKDIVLPGSAAYIRRDLSVLAAYELWDVVYCHSVRKIQELQNCMA
jgi:hypothetical protein